MLSVKLMWKYKEPRGARVRAMGSPPPAINTYRTVVSARRQRGRAMGKSIEYNADRENEIVTCPVMMVILP